MYSLVPGIRSIIRNGPAGALLCHRGLGVHPSARKATAPNAATMAVEGSGTADAAAMSKFGPKKPGPPSSSNLPTWLKPDPPQDPSHVAVEADSHDPIRPRRGSPATACGPGVPPRAMNRSYPLTCAAGAFRDRLSWKEQERSFLAVCDVQHPAGNGYGGNGYGDAARFHLSPRPVRQWWWPGRAEGRLHPDSLGRAGSNAGRFNRDRGTPYLIPANSGSGDTIPNSGQLWIGGHQGSGDAVPNCGQLWRLCSHHM
jgi:hypothetical protein